MKICICLLCIALCIQTTGCKQISPEPAVSAPENTAQNAAAETEPATTRPPETTVFTMMDVQATLPVAAVQTVANHIYGAQTRQTIIINEWECQANGVSYLVIQHLATDAEAVSSIGQLCDVYFEEQHGARLSTTEGQGNDLLIDTDTRGMLNAYIGKLVHDSGTMCKLGYFVETEEIWAIYVTAHENEAAVQAFEALKRSIIVLQ